jgi:subtilisin family serine protease
VINLSLAGPPDPLLSQLLDQAIQRGIVIVAADPWPAPAGGFPTSHADVIAVQAPNSRVEPQERLLLAAPGEEILTTTPKATYSFLSGNSLAAAHVTGVVALLKERNPSLGTAQIAALLSATATVIGGTKSINACLALQRLDAQVLCAN